MAAPAAWRGGAPSSPPTRGDEVWARTAHFVLSLAAVIAFCAAVIWPLIRLVS